jgi:hypothetical protein
MDLDEGFKEIAVFFVILWDHKVLFLIYLLIVIEESLRNDW